LSWDVVAAAGKAKTIDVFLNFPMEGINRDALWGNPAELDADRIARMTRFWGDDSWKDVAYASRKDLFGETEVVKRPGNEPVVRAYRERLRQVAGFRFVPESMPMRNSKGAVVYYLFFTSHNQAGDRIARQIFRKYRSRGVS
jgi:three-Cys-motif partner protein